MLVSLLLLAAPPTSTGGDGKVALRLEKGSLTRNQMVAIGKDVIVAGEALSDVAAMEGSVEVTGRVAGDVVVLGGGLCSYQPARAATNGAWLLLAAVGVSALKRRRSRNDAKPRS